MSHASPAEADAPLTFGQERQYRTGKTVPQYFTFRIDGILDVPAFAAAVGALVRRHDALTLGFGRSDDKPGSVTQRPHPVSADELMDCVAVGSRSDEQFSRYVRNVLRSEIERPWDLSCGRLFRFRLFRFSPTLHAFVASLCSLTVDAPSRRLLVRDLWWLYAEYAAGREPVSEPNALLFISAARQQHERFVRKANTVNAQFWRERLRQLPVGERWDASADLRAEATLACTEIREELDGAWLARARAACDQQGLAFAHWIFTVLASVFFHVGSARLLAITVPIDTRRRDERDIVGMFTRAIPIILHRDEWRRDPAGYPRRELLSGILHCYVGEDAIGEFRRRLNDPDNPEGFGPIQLSMLHAEHHPDDLLPPIDPSLGILVTEGSYNPRLPYGSAGFDLISTAFSDKLVVVMRFNKRLFSERAAHAAADLFMTRLHGSQVGSSVALMTHGVVARGISYDTRQVAHARDDRL